nr:hypothetical protein [Tanacetum cinerariifolium]
FGHLLDNSCEGFQVQQAEGFTAFPFLPMSALRFLVLPVVNFLLEVGNFLWAVGKFLLPVENFLLTEGTYLLAVDTHGALYEFFTADDLRKGLKGGLIEFPCGLGPEDLSGGLI